MWWNLNFDLAKLPWGIFEMVNGYVVSKVILLSKYVDNINTWLFPNTYWRPETRQTKSWAKVC